MPLYFVVLQLRTGLAASILPHSAALANVCRAANWSCGCRASHCRGPHSSRCSLSLHPPAPVSQFFSPGTRKPVDSPLSYTIITYSSPTAPSRRPALHPPAGRSLKTRICLFQHSRRCRRGGLALGVCPTTTLFSPPKENSVGATPSLVITCGEKTEFCTTPHFSRVRNASRNSLPHRPLHSPRFCAATARQAQNRLASDRTAGVVNASVRRGPASAAPFAGCRRCGSNPARPAYRRGSSSRTP
jgi:hypothetical protein